MIDRPRSYHHGDLRRALVEEGLRLARDRGMAALGLREVTRSVGVTANAAYRHFPDRHGLVLAVAIEAQQKLARHLADRMQADSVGVPADELALRHLRAFCLGYIEFALEERGWFELACYTQHAPADAVPTLAEGQPVAPPYLLLIDALDELVAAGALSHAQRVDAEWVCWSGVQGFTELAIDGPLDGQDRAVLDRLATRVVDVLIRGLAPLSQ